MPDNFDGVYGTGHKKNWSPSRFAASVDWVSDITESEGFGAPTVERQVNGELAIANGTLLTAFINERTRIASKPSGSWHDTHFPRHAPIIATPDMVEELQALGAILVEPNYGQITHDTYYNVDVITPSHAFQCASDSDLNAHDISLSMSFLPYDVITDLRNNPQSKKVLLVPHDTRIAQLPALPVPDTLRVAMRYHRPDFFKNRASNALYDFHVVGISTRAYLRGMDINYEHNNKLSITAEILTDPRLTRAFSSPLETQYLQEFFTPGNNDRPQYAWLDQTPNGGPFEQQIDNLLGNLDILIKHLDYMPRLKFYGSEDFVRAFVERNIPITNINDCSFWKEEGSYAPSGIQTDAQKRLSARLGDVGYKFPELPPEELLVKAVRTNDSTFHQRACGVLDRLGVVEVANLARTPAQRTFVIENFDVRSHVKELPVAIRKMISGPMLEDALGL
jgi:hypothetical protein